MLRRWGFTVVELLVVVAIIGILMALLLPAVNSARETARRTTCQNNVRNIALATLSFNTTNGYFPPAGTHTATLDKNEIPQRPQISAHGVITRLLPYFDEAATFNQLDLRYNFNDKTHKTNSGATNFELTHQDLGGIVICPSAPGGRVDTAPSDYAPINRVVPSTGLKPLIGKAITDRTLKNRQKNLDGSFVAWDGILQVEEVWQKNGRYVMDRRRVTSDRVRDGLSSTLLFVEDAGRPRCYTGSKLGCLNRNGISVDDTNSFRHYWSTWLLYIALNDYCYQSQLINCGNNSQPYSFHTGGINVAKGDASVEFLSDAIDAETFVSLVTMNGGEVISDY
jgi:prepilin-type N-terminal cleavage/methylation domain-containing protein